MDLWRISKFPSLDGEGGRLYAARWNSTGEPIVYLAASPPGALIEILVHLEMKDVTLPPTYTLLRISVPEALRISSLKVPEGNTWKRNEATSRALGDAWLKSRRSALARVPSAILPETYNYLLNPLHPDAAKIRIVAAITGVWIVDGSNERAPRWPKFYNRTLVRLTIDTRVEKAKDCLSVAFRM